MNTLSKSSSIAMAIALVFSMLATSTSLNAQSQDSDAAGSERSINADVKPAATPTLSFRESVKKKAAEQKVVKQTTVVKPTAVKFAPAPVAVKANLAVESSVISTKDSERPSYTKGVGVTETKLQPNNIQIAVSSQQNAAKINMVDATPSELNNLQSKKSVNAEAVATKPKAANTNDATNDKDSNNENIQSVVSKPISTSVNDVEKSVSNKIVDDKPIVEKEVKQEQAIYDLNYFNEKVKNMEQQVTSFSKSDIAVSKSLSLNASSQLDASTQSLKELLIKYLQFLESEKSAGKGSPKVASEIEAIKNRLATL